MGDYVEDLENWMSLLPEKIRALPIIYLAIPGSHNSMTYGINKASKVASDAENSVRKIYKVFPEIVRRWAITQKLDVHEQLKIGIRFFDLRICTQNGLFYYAHGLYSFEVSEAFWSIVRFLDTHPREVVILDFQHFYDMNDDDHKFLQRIIRSIFGDKLYARHTGPLPNWNLTDAEKSRKQIVIIYRWNAVPMEFWPSFMWPTPWANTVKVQELRDFLETQLENRQPGTGHVLQCILTPTPKYIVYRFCFSLESLAKKVDDKLMTWIQEQRPGLFYAGEKPRVNVFLGDFVNIRDSKFCKAVIGLNGYLMKS